MGRPPVIPSEKKIRIVLSILAGEISLAEATRREKVSEQSIGRWKAEFLEGGKAALVAGKTGPSIRPCRGSSTRAGVCGCEIGIRDRYARCTRPRHRGGRQRCSKR